MGNVEEETRKLFKKLHLPLEYVPDALTALNKHSQGNVFGTSNMNNEDLISDWKCVNSAFNQIDVPLTVEMSLEELAKLLDCSDQ